MIPFEMWVIICNDAPETETYLGHCQIYVRQIFGKAVNS